VNVEDPIESDNTKPYLVSCYPPEGGTEIPKNTSIQLKADDDGYGVNLYTLNVTINSLPILQNGIDQTNNRLTTTSHSPTYTIHYNPDYDFIEGSIVTVNVQCQDMASPPNSLDSTYTFTIGSSFITSTEGYDADQTGCVITDQASGIQIHIPAGALDDSTEITIERIDNPPVLPDTVMGIGLSCHFGPSGLQFADSVVIWIPYTQDDLDCAGVTHPAELPIFYFSTMKGIWINLRIFDTNESYIFIKVKEFCYFTYGKLICTDVETQILDNLSPQQFDLMQNYPNPFNPETIISYRIPRDGHVTLEIYNMTGQRIRTLVSEDKMAGLYEVVWNGRADGGEVVGSGMYLYCIQSEGHFKMMKATLIK